MTGPATSSRPAPVRLTLLMCAAEVLSMTGFAAYTTLLPALQREWSLSNSEAGLISGIYFAGYVAATPVLTSLTDRVDARRVYLIGCCLALGGSAAFMMFAGGLWSALFFQFLIGAGLGLAAALGLSRVAETVLFGLSGRDPAVFVAATAVLAAVIFAASWLPAWRASRVAPMEALRYE